MFVFEACVYDVQMFFVRWFIPLCFANENKPIINCQHTNIYILFYFMRYAATCFGFHCSCRQAAYIKQV